MARGQSNSSNILVVPEAGKALDAMKYEIAAELGLPVGKSYQFDPTSEFATELGAIPASSIREDYWGHIATRDAGAVGGNMTRRLVQKAEEILYSL
jgi:hypothetical protein